MCTTSSPELGARCGVPSSTIRFRSVTSTLVPAACPFLGHALGVGAAVSSAADIAHVRAVETDDFIDAPERGTVAFPIDADGVVAPRTVVGGAACGSLHTIDARTRGPYGIEPDGSLERMGTFPAEHRSEPRAAVLAPRLDKIDDPKRRHPFVLTSERADGEVHEWPLPRGESASS